MCKQTEKTNQHRPPPVILVLVSLLCGLLWSANLWALEPQKVSTYTQVNSYGVFDGSENANEVYQRDLLKELESMGYTHVRIDPIGSAKQTQTLKSLSWQWGGRVEVVAVRVGKVELLVAPSGEGQFAEGKDAQPVKVLTPLAPFATVKEGVCTIVVSYNWAEDSHSSDSVAYKSYQKAVNRAPTSSAWTKLNASEFERFILIHEATHCQAAWGRLGFLHPQWDIRTNSVLAKTVFNPFASSKAQGEFEHQKPSTLYGEMLADVFGGVDLLEQNDKNIAPKKLASLRLWRKGQADQDQSRIIHEHDTQKAIELLMNLEGREARLLKEMPEFSIDEWVRKIASEAVAITLLEKKVYHVQPLLHYAVSRAELRSQLVSEGFGALWQKRSMHKNEESLFHRVITQEAQNASALFFLENQELFTKTLEDHFVSNACILEMKNGSKKFICENENQDIVYKELHTEEFINEWVDRLLSRLEEEGLIQALAKLTPPAPR